MRIISLDFAIKTILKSEDKKIIEGLLTSLMTYINKENTVIKIVEFLDKENIKDEEYLKTSVADLLVKDQNDDHYVFEIERSDDDTIFHKALSNTSKLIHHCITRQGTNKRDYLAIKKIFHITLAFFDIGSDACIVAGKTKFNDLKNNKPFQFHLSDKNNKTIIATDIFPEFITLAVPNLDEGQKDNIHQWLYAFKEAEIKDEFNAPGIKEAAIKLDYFKMTPQQKAGYEEYQKKIASESSITRTHFNKGKNEGIQEGKAVGIQEGKAVGIQEGKAVGETKAKETIIKNMLNKNMNIKDIAEIANVDISFVEQIKNK